MSTPENVAAEPNEAPAESDEAPAESHELAASPDQVIAEPAPPPSTPKKPRRWPWRVCAVIAGIMLFVANLQSWVYRNIADTDAFVETTAEVLEFENVREALATRIVDRLFEGRPLLRVAAGEAVEAAVVGLLGSDAFNTVLTGLATQLHQALTEGTQPSITIQSQQLQALVVVVAKVVAPEEANDLQFNDEGLVIELFPNTEIPSYESEIDTLHWLGIVAGIIGLILLVLPIVLRRDAWSVRLAGLTILAVSAVTFVAVPVIGWVLEGQANDDDGATVVGEIYDAFSRSLVAHAVILLFIGAVIVGVAWWMESRARGSEPEQVAEGARA